jgi:tungstate transport system permease protein
VSFFWDGLAQAWQLIVNGNPYLWNLTGVTLLVAGVSSGIAVVIGLPLGLLLGIGRSRGRRIGFALANAGLGLPPVVVGIVLVLLLLPSSLLGPLRLLFTLQGVLVAQTILALPIVIALTASAVRSISPGLLDQARAFGASGPQVGWLALREARIGVLAAIIAAVGAGLSEVGAVVLVGGNIEGDDQTLASAALEQVEAGSFGTAFAIGILLLFLIAVIAIALTLLQFWDGRSRPRTLA